MLITEMRVGLAFDSGHDVWMFMNSAGDFDKGQVVRMSTIHTAYLLHVYSLVCRC